jgi:hypothetical protein
MRVMDTEFESPLTHGWAVNYQREVFKGNVLEVAYIGRRAEHLFGAYDVNQAEIFDNGFLDAFNVVKAGGESALMNQLLARIRDDGSARPDRSSCDASSPQTCSRTPWGHSRVRWGAGCRVAGHCPTSPALDRSSSIRIRSSWAVARTRRSR